MADNKEPKPIKTERIDNPDGTYVLKEVFDTPVLVNILSDIEYYSKDDQLIKGTYFKDKNFNNLEFEVERIYNPDKSYTNMLKYIEPESNDGIGSEIQKCKQKDKPYYMECYKTNNFQELIATIERIYNDDGSHIDKIKFCGDDTYSEIVKFNSNEGIYYSERYNDNNFKDLDSIREWVYNEDGSYIIKKIETEPDEDGFLSSVEYFNKYGQSIKGLGYSDNNFKNLSKVIEKKYNLDGSYILKSKLSRPNAFGWLSYIENFDETNRYIYGKYYEDKHFHKLGLIQEKFYANDNGSYSYKLKYTKPNENGWLSYIKNLDGKDRYIYGEFFEDRNFEHIGLIQERSNNDDGSYSDKFQYTKPDKNGWLSSIENFDNKNRYIYGEFFEDRNFKQTGLIQERSNNDDGSYVIKGSYTKPDENGWLSSIEKYDKNNLFSYGEYYENKHFQNIGLKKERRYNDDGSYIDKCIFIKPNVNGWLSSIENYDKNNRFTSGKAFVDEHFQELGLASEKKYNKDGSYNEKLTYSKVNKYGWLTGRQFYNKNSKIIHAIAYIDNEQQKIYRKSYFKYLPNNALVILREYASQKDGYFSEIEKYDNDSIARTLIYKHQYKFKGLLAKIIFGLCQ